MAEKIRQNDVTVTGNLVDDPKLVEGPNGKFVAMRVAHNQRVRDRDNGGYRDGPTTFYDVGINDQRMAANAVASLKKGQRVTVRGNQVTEPYVHPETGQAHLSRKIYDAEVSASLRWQTQQAGPAADPAATLGVQPDAEAHAQTQTQQSGPQPETTPEGRRLQEEAARSWAQLQATQQTQQQATQPGPGVN